MSLKLLWDLQELDLSLGALAEQFEGTPLRGRLKRRRKAWPGLKKSAAGEAGLQEQRKTLRRGELDLETVTAEHGELNKKLYSGTVKNIKELEQMEIKLGSVKEAACPGRAPQPYGGDRKRGRAASGSGGEVDAAVAEHQRRQRLLEEELARIDYEREELQQQRDELAKKLNRRVSACGRSGTEASGQECSRVINDICQGCSVFISSAQRVFSTIPRPWSTKTAVALVRFTEERRAEQAK